MRLCYTCRHPVEGAGCEETAKALTPGWAQASGILTDRNAPPRGVAYCPRYEEREVAEEVGRVV